MSVSEPTTADAPRRGPGRPRRTDEEQARVQELIVAATERVFSRHRFHEVTVTRIIEAAGIPRSTFYHYFRNAEEPLRIVIDRFGATLLRELGDAVTAASGPVERTWAGIDAYLGWARSWRHLLPSVLADLHDSTSPVYGVRRQAREAVSLLIVREVGELGGTPPPAAAVDVFVNAVEYTCYRIFLADVSGPGEEEQEFAMARDLMYRLARALFLY